MELSRDRLASNKTKTPIKQENQGDQRKQYYAQATKTTFSAAIGYIFNNNIKNDFSAICAINQQHCQKTANTPTHS